MEDVMVKWLAHQTAVLGSNLELTSVTPEGRGKVTMKGTWRSQNPSGDEL